MKVDIQGVLINAFTLPQPCLRQSIKMPRRRNDRAINIIIFVHSARKGRDRNEKKGTEIAKKQKTAVVLYRM